MGATVGRHSDCAVICATQSSPPRNPWEDAPIADKDACIAKAKARLDRWNADIEEPQSKAAEAEADARIEYDKQIADLRKQRDEAEAKMKEMREASEEAWGDMKAGFDRAWRSVSGAFDKAMARFR